MAFSGHRISYVLSVVSGPSPYLAYMPAVGYLAITKYPGVSFFNHCETTPSL